MLRVPHSPQRRKLKHRICSGGYGTVCPADGRDQRKIAALFETAGQSHINIICPGREAGLIQMIEMPVETDHILRQFLQYAYAISRRLFPKV